MWGRCSYLAPFKCKARRNQNVPAREGPAGVFYVCFPCADRRVQAVALTRGERAVVTAILSGMVLVIAFFVVGMLFPELLPWYGRWGRVGL